MVKIIRRLDDGTYSVTDTADRIRIATAVQRQGAARANALYAEEKRPTKASNATPVICAVAGLALLVSGAYAFKDHIFGSDTDAPDAEPEYVVVPPEPEQPSPLPMPAPITEPEILPDSASPLPETESDEVIIVPNEDGDSVIRPRMRPAFIDNTAVLPLEVLEAQGFDLDAPYRAMGCGAQRGFNEFWSAGLDRTPYFQHFVEDYRQRLSLPEQINQNSIRAHRRMLQIMLGLNECYDTINASTYDAAIGPATEGAIMRFQEENGLEQSGRADMQTLDLLVHASAMRVMYNMHVLDVTAEQFDIDVLGVFQKAWHESYYSHTAVSATGADGIGQFVESTFLQELERSEHPFYAEYMSARAEGGEALTQANAELRRLQHDVWVNAHMMLSHCDYLLDRFNEASCSSVYGAYQLGVSGYGRLIRAASQTPNVRASSVTRGTVSNGYGHYRAASALSYVRGLINSDADVERAVRDLEFLNNIRAQRAFLVEPSLGEAALQNDLATARSIVFTIDG